MSLSNLSLNPNPNRSLNRNQANYNTTRIADTFNLSFKKIAFYNFIFIGLCLLITTFIIYTMYSDEDLDKDRTTIVAILLSCLFLSNILLLLGTYIAKRYNLTPFTQIIVALLSFAIGYVTGYYLGQTIGESMTDDKKGKVDKDTAALQAAIAEVKKKKSDLEQETKKETEEVKEEIVKVESTIGGNVKSVLGKLGLNVGPHEKRKIKINEYPFKYSYGLSFWLFIEAQPPNVGGAYAKYVNILDYGGKPAIRYKGSKNELKITFRLNDDNDNHTEREILLYDKLKYQKWNHFIVNYDRGTVDVFVNNVLLATEGSIAPYMIHDDVVVGEDDGINGGIKDVKYFPQPIDLKTIKHLFRMY